MSNAGWRAPQPPTPHPSGERPWPFGRRGLLLLSASRILIAERDALTQVPFRSLARRERSDNAIVIFSRRAARPDRRGAPSRSARQIRGSTRYPPRSGL